MGKISFQIFSQVFIGMVYFFNLVEPGDQDGRTMTNPGQPANLTGYTGTVIRGGFGLNAGNF